jgi:serine/threonine-protein kinase
MVVSPAPEHFVLGGRYIVHDEIASGGMATVHLGCPVGSTQPVVALKLPHRHLLGDEKLVRTFFDEARLAARIVHPNVVPIIDVIQQGADLALVLEYVDGASLSILRQGCEAAGIRIPPAVSATIVAAVLRGIHAAHEATDEQGTPLEVVHRDVSPQNILISSEGVARITDFGVAKALGRMQTTTESGHFKGKFAYMAPEQARGRDVDRRADVFAAGIILWELLTSERLFGAQIDPAVVLTKILFEEPPPPSKHVGDLPPNADAVVLRALARDPNDRYATAEEMAVAVEQTFGTVPASEIAELLHRVAGEEIAKRRASARRVSLGAAPLAGPRSVRPEGPSGTVVLPIPDRALAATIDEPLSPPRRSRLHWVIGGGIAATAVIVGSVVLATRTPSLAARMAVPAASASATMTPSRAPAMPATSTTNAAAAADVAPASPPVSVATTGTGPLRPRKPGPTPAAPVAVASAAKARAPAASPSPAPTASHAAPPSAPSTPSYLKGIPGGPADPPP